MSKKIVGNFKTYQIMNKTFVFLILILVASITSLKAQFLVGGSLSFNSSKEILTNDTTTKDGDHLTSFTVYPKVGIFITDKLALGLGGMIKSIENTGPDYGTRQYIFWSVAPYARYYLINRGKFKFFGDGSLGIGGSKTPTHSTNDVWYYSKSVDLTFTLSPAISYDLSEKIMLEVLLGNINAYTSFVSYDDSENKKTKYGGYFNFGLNHLTFGMTVKLGGKKQNQN